MQLSIVVPIYNVEKYLEKCLISIQKQTFSDYEVLLINDGSTDNSKEIAEKFSKQDNRFKYFEIANAGVSSARNLGIEKASGKYLTFIDSDDYLDLEHLQMFMEKMGHYNMVIGGYKVIGLETEVRNHEIGQVFNQQQLIQGILKDSAIYSFPWNKFFEREIIDAHKIRFRTDIHYGEDLIFDIQYALQVENSYILNNDSYNYVQRGGSASGKLDKNSLAKRMTDIDAIICTISLLEKKYPDEIVFLKERVAREGLNYWHLAIKLGFPQNITNEYKLKIQPYINWFLHVRAKDARTGKLLLKYMAYSVVAAFN